MDWTLVFIIGAVAINTLLLQRAVRFIRYRRSGPVWRKADRLRFYGRDEPLLPSDKVDLTRFCEDVVEPPVYEEFPRGRLPLDQQYRKIQREFVGKARILFLHACGGTGTGHQRGTRSRYLRECGGNTQISF